MHKNTPYLLTINSGSSSIKFALFNISGELTRVLEGKIEGIGSTHTTFSVKNQMIAPSFNRPVVAKDFAAAVTFFLAWFDTLMLKDNLKAIGHRLVHGGAHFLSLFFSLKT